MLIVDLSLLIQSRLVFSLSNKRPDYYNLTYVKDSDVWLRFIESLKYILSLALMSNYWTNLRPFQL
jgi:hypothetical protein